VVDGPEAVVRVVIVFLAVLALSACTGGALAPTGTLDETPTHPLPSASSTLTPTRTSLPEPTRDVTPTGEVAWTEIGEIRSEEIAYGSGVSVVGSLDGYVAFDGSPVVQVSTDGVVWRPVKLRGKENDDTDAVVLAANGREVMIVGSTRGGPASWVTDDLRTWRRSAPLPRDPAPLGRYRSEFDAVVAVPTGGWDAAQTFRTESLGDSFGVAMWHSDDGTSWTQQRAIQADLFEDEWYDCQQGWSAEPPSLLVDATGRRLIAVDPCGDDRGLWTSIDGRDYAPLSVVPGTGDIGPKVAASTGRPWIVVEYLETSFPEASFKVWTSDDLVKWTEAPLPAPSRLYQPRVETLDDVGGLFLATGSARHDAVTWPGLTWLSEDARSWRLAIVTPDGLVFDDVAHGPAGPLGFGSVVVGYDPDEEEDLYGVVVWRLARER
jgi:hypothetical protein